MKKLLFTSFIALAVFFMACSDDNSTQPDNEIDTSHLGSLGTTAIGDYTVEMYSEKQELLTGYNTLYFTIKDSDGEYIITDDLSVSVIMDMAENAHGCPTEGIKNTNGLFSLDLVFTMPSNESEKWVSQIRLFDDDNLVGEFRFDVSSSNRIKNFMHDSEMYFVSLVKFDEAKVGLNDFEIVIHKKESAYEWPPQDDMTIKITPWMPGMGHGSPNNENPILTENGHYRGKVNFTMTGYWEITVKVSINETEIAEVIFPIEL